MTKDELIEVLKAAYPDVQDSRRHENAAIEIILSYEKAWERDKSKKLVEAVGTFMAAYEAQAKKYDDE